LAHTPHGALQGYPVDLNGTLDIMLQNGVVPTIGESFTIITTLSGDLSGTFSNVTWDSFDYGRDYFLVTYHDGAGVVELTAEATVPRTWNSVSIVDRLSGVALWRIHSIARISLPLSN
jgi:hypothetical protein